MRTIIRQNAEHFALPDFRNKGTILRAVLAVNALVAIAALIRSSSWEGWFAEWMDIWVPRCLEAARALQPIWSTPADKAVTFASSFDAAIAKFTALLQEIELDIPEELSK
jgi:hypothetical protein